MCAQKAEKIIEKRKIQIKNDLYKLFELSVFILLSFLIVVFFITRYENVLIARIIDSYEKKIKARNKKLQNLNKNLQKEVSRKTDELMRSLFIDPLTSLPNREKLLSDIEKHKYVAILNVNSFKEINDFYGLEVGDEVLKRLAEILKKYDAYKLPSDEFAIIGDDEDELKQKVEKICKEVENHKFSLQDNINIDISLSAGIGENLQKADMALKFAKSRKATNIMVYNDNLPIVKEYKNNIKWKNILKTVIKENRVIPYVQPIVNAETYETEKYECLIRVEYEGEIYAPHHFLEISKQTGQYFELQRIMIDKCFSAFKDIDYKFSINLSALELSNEQFKEFLVGKITEYDVSEKLIIELLEDENLSDEELMGFLIFLHTMDVEFAIDDFGSGHSNLSYLLSKLPVSILKIDGSLIKNVNTDVNNYKLVKALVNMAKIFNLSVVAEFVENEEVAQTLKKLKVDYFQGYYFGKPEPLNEILRKIKSVV
jgi:diguanylate cyclase (GGDEF)-like protein